MDMQKSNGKRKRKRVLSMVLSTLLLFQTGLSAEWTAGIQVKAYQSESGAEGRILEENTEPETVKESQGNETESKTTDEAEEEIKKETSSQTEEKIEDETSSQIEEKTEDETSNQTEEKAEDETSSQTEEKTEDETSNQTEEKAEDETSSQTEEKTENESTTVTENEIPNIVVDSNIQVPVQDTISDTGIMNIEFNNAESKAEGKHLAAKSNIIVDENFDSADHWDIENKNGTVKIENGEAVINGSGPNNRLGYNVEKINVDNFLIQLDMTPHMTKELCALDLKIAFKIVDQYEGDRMQVRFSFKNNLIFIERTTETAPQGIPFTWNPDQTYAVDIEVNSEENTIQVYMDGELVAEQAYEKLGSMKKGYFAIAGQFPNQNITIDNVKISSEEEAVPDEDTGDDTDEGEKKEVIHYLKAYDRILVQDNFENGDKWTPNNTSVSFADGKATIKGGGPCNRMGYNVGKINANDFLIQCDLTPNAMNTNSNTKFAFKITDQYEGDRLQVRILYPQKQIVIERTKNNDQANFTQVWSSEPAEFIFESGQPYAIDILVKGDNIKLYIDGDSTPVLDVTHEDIASMAKGYFAIAGQYPAQDFSIENLMLTTDEVQQGEQYTVTLKTAVVGDVDNSNGGTIAADIEKGYAGDTVELTVNPAHGYVFDHFESFKWDGSSTDGLMPINNNRFQLDPKFGNVTVVAYFKLREAGRFELFYDDFAAETLNAQYTTIKDAAQAVQENGELTLQAEGGNNYLLLNQAIFQDQKEGEGYRISVDMWKGNGTDGTVQLMFKGADNSIDGRYVLVLNGSVALFRHLYGSANDELCKANFTFSEKKVHIELEIKENQVVFYADGKEILQYTTEDNWSDQPNAVGLINMTAGAPVVFDNLLVERIPKEIGIAVKVLQEQNGVQTEDKDGISGTVTTDVIRAVEGDIVKLQVLEKSGYRLKELYAEDSSQGIAIQENTFTVPIGITGNITIIAVFETEDHKEGRGYYIDSEAGDDSNPGTIESPWKTLNRLADKNLTLVPGDSIYLKRGSVFESQQLCFQGMGTKENPIRIDAYGEGNALPRLNGNGEIENVVSLFNQEYIEIKNLEITNTSPEYDSSFGLNSSTNRKLALRAINVSAKDFGVVSGIRIQDCYIHDINGNIGLKWNGGIFFDVQASIIGGELTGVPTKYDDVIIEGCTFINVDRSGIKMVSSSWCNQWVPNSPNVPLNWYPSTNIVIRNNYMERIGGDGITTRDTDGTVIEYNLVKDCRYQETAYNVGIWPFQAANTVIQYNEAYNTHSVQDGQGLDCDHASSYSLMQYNYSHNNEGGFMLIMGGYPHTAATVRYNISQNDYDKTFEFAQGIPNGTMIYNNTLYSDTLVERGVLFLSNTGAGLGVNDMYLFNNLFCYPEGQSFYGGPETAKLTEVAKLYNNAYVGGIQAPTADSNPIVAADKNSVLSAPGTAPEENDTQIARTGDSGELDGYQLLANAPVIDKGITMQEAIEYFGNGTAKIVDGRSLSPNELYQQAKEGNSIDYIMGENFPRVDWVSYDIDFFGNASLEGEKPDIGAAEYLQHTHTGGTATCVSKAVCTICNVEYGKIDPANHTGNTEIRNAKKPTTTEKGYTGDVYCKDCGEKIADGKVIPRLTDSSDSEDSSDDRGNTDREETISLTRTEENLLRDTFGSSAAKEVITQNNGKLITTVSNEKVFVEKDGSLSKNKWQQVDGAWYFFQTDGRAAAGWIKQKEVWYYLNDTSKKMETGWKRTADGKWYLLDRINGDMKTGWQKTANGKWYLLDAINGDMKTGWQKTANGKWYLLDAINGDMKTGWQKTADGKWYLLDAINGDMKIGWQIVNGIWYYLTETGAMAEDTVTPDGYKVGKDGGWTGEKVR